MIVDAFDLVVPWRPGRICEDLFIPTTLQFLGKRGLSRSLWTDEENMDIIAHDRLLSFRSGVYEEIEVRIRSAVIMVDGEITQQSGFGPDHHMVPSINSET